jgi:thiamine biosynthesis lipoprotein
VRRLRHTALLAAAAIALIGCGKKDDSGKRSGPSEVPKDVLDRAADSDAAPPRRATTDSAYSRSEKAMGTRVSVTIWTDDEAGAARAASAVYDEFDRVNRLMSSWLPDSDVARINAAAGGEPVKVDPELVTVIQKALDIARATGGAFDITVGAFRGLWKFDQDLDGSIPKKPQVEERLALVGYQNVEVDPANQTVRLAKKGMRITLGGIAKGYAVDRAVALLHERNFVDFIVQAGGDLYVSGRKGDRAWRVGIRDPRGGPNDSFALLELENGTFSTSGDYERGLVIDGVRYHHILDPETGYPATRSRSVTVLAQDALTADVWSTSLFIIGADKGLPMVEKMAGVEAVFVDADNQVHMSSGLKGRLKIVHPPTDGI